MSSSFPTQTHLLNFDRPYLSLTIRFALWKTLLLVIVLLAPSPGYDTSTFLLPPFYDCESAASGVRQAVSHFATKLVRWDAIYFTQIARRDYVYEQEWAFGWGYTRVLGILARLVFGFKEVTTEQVALIGVLVAHVSHWGSVLMLYELTKEVFETTSGTWGYALPLLSSCLHIISPAGVFLSAPYAEAPFSLLNFAGCYTFAKSIKAWVHGKSMSGTMLTIASGMLFGVATLFRGNGLLSGITLLASALDTAWNRWITVEERGSHSASMTRLFALGFSGIVMACIAIWPQHLAYSEFCVKPAMEDPRSWCRSLIPSVYSWVQKEYWGVGFLRYWTMSNTPLFLLATPILTIMLASCKWAWGVPFASRRQLKAVSMSDKSKRQDFDSQLRPRRRLLIYLTLPQLALAILALTTYHVQIITRLSSGYAIWYWWLSLLLMDGGDVQILGKKRNVAKAIVMWMAVYALLQGGLFASFLPPA